MSALQEEIDILKSEIEGYRNDLSVDHKRREDDVWRVDYRDT